MEQCYLHFRWYFSLGGNEMYHYCAVNCQLSVQPQCCWWKTQDVPCRSIVAVGDEEGVLWRDKPLCRLKLEENGNLLRRTEWEIPFYMDVCSTFSGWDWNWNRNLRTRICKETEGDAFGEIKAGTWTLPVSVMLATGRRGGKRTGRMFLLNLERICVNLLENLSQNLLEWWNKSEETNLILTLHWVWADRKARSQKPVE